jgi:hypothetical protein
MQPVFEPIDILKQNDYLQYFARSPQKASDYSFINLWGWADIYGLQWAWTDNLVWIRQSEPEDAYWAPVGDWHGVAWDTEFFQHVQRPASIIRVPEILLEVWRGKNVTGLTADESRGHWDYLYAVDELINLSGRRFHKKKNLLNRFKKEYTYRYANFNAGMIEKARSMQNDWCTWRDCEAFESLSAENRSIGKIFDHWEQLPMAAGGVITVEGILAAYTIAEVLDPDTLLIHFEKGDPAFKGIYQAINQIHLDQTNYGTRIVNREQDLDDAGLRKAKLSYHPKAFIKKYSVALH